MRERLIGSDLSSRPSWKVEAKVECCRSCDFFGCRVMDCSATRILSLSIKGYPQRPTRGSVRNTYPCDGNKGVLHIPQRSRITRTSSSDCLESNPGHPLVRSYPSEEMQSVYSTSPADWAGYLIG